MGSLPSDPDAGPLRSLGCGWADGREVPICRGRRSGQTPVGSLVTPNSLGAGRWETGMGTTAVSGKDRPPLGEPGPATRVTPGRRRPKGHPPLPHSLSTSPGDGPQNRGDIPYRNEDKVCFYFGPFRTGFRLEDMFRPDPRLGPRRPSVVVPRYTTPRPTDRSDTTGRRDTKRPVDEDARDSDTESTPDLVPLK